jgi:hypothetical protein
VSDLPAEAKADAFEARLRVANQLLLAAARRDRAHRTRGWRARRRAIRELPARPDGLDFETEAAKISDTVAIYAGDQSLPVGLTFDAIEGRS